ncbi:alpha/beta fold hydrolase [Pseudomonas sp. GB2N2]
MNMNMLKKTICIGALVIASSMSLAAAIAGSVSQDSSKDTSDSALLETLPGFVSEFATVNGTKIHYVTGGKGNPIFLLPGWPETWWSYHKIMPQLAKDHRVVVVDIRGMGSSDKPDAGYEKKNMSKDVYELAKKMGYEKIDVLGHDIGAQVAYAIAANYPQMTKTLTLLDVPPSDEGLYKWPILPSVGTFGDKIDADHPFAWWFAFHQVKKMPEELLAGRVQIEQEWFFRYLLKDENAIDARDRAVYANAYNTKDAIRAGNAWYQAFPQDIVDHKGYGDLSMPVLAIGGPGFNWLKGTLEPKVPNLKLVHMEDSGHFIAEEKPEETVKILKEFLGGK